MKDAYCNNYLENQTCRKENLIEKFFFQSKFLPVFFNILFDDIHECFISVYSRGSKICYAQRRTIYIYIYSLLSFRYSYICWQTLSSTYPKIFLHYGYRTRHKKYLGGAVSFFVRKIRKMRIYKEIITHIVLIFESGKWPIGKI